MSRFLNSVRRRSASPGTPKKAATPSPKGTTTTQSPVTATTPATPSPAARTPGSTSSRRKKYPAIPTHGPDGKPLKKSELRQMKIRRREKQLMDSDADVWREPRYWQKQNDYKWQGDTKQAAEQFMNRYANLGPEAIRAEFLKEVGDYRNPNTAHTWFDAYPDKNKNKDQITCLDENRVMLPSDNTKYINASWAEIKKPTFAHSASLLQTLHRKYILTQIPLESTMEEYWQMILEHKATLVLLLLPKQEDPKKVDKFWPSMLDEEKVHGSMTITCVEKSIIMGSNVCILEVLQKGKQPHLVWFCACASPSLDRPYADAVVTTQNLCTLTSFIDQMEDESGSHISYMKPVLIMDECGGTTRASLLLLVDAACELIREMSVNKPLQIADVFKWAIGCRGGTALGEEEYLLAVQAVAEYIWRSTNCFEPEDKKEFNKKTPEERKEIEEQYKVKYAELYKKIVGKAPGKKWHDKD